MWRCAHVGRTCSSSFCSSLTSFSHISQAHSSLKQGLLHWFPAPGKMDQSTARLEGTCWSCLYLTSLAEWSRLDQGAALWCLSLAPETEKIFAYSQESVFPPHPILWLGIRALGLVSTSHLPLSCVSGTSISCVSSFKDFMELLELLSSLHSPFHLTKRGFCFCWILLLCNITASSWVWCWMERSLLQ